MTMGKNEGFKEYAQKWRDLTSRVQPPLTDREHIDIFMGTLSGPFYNLLVGCYSSGFTELILTDERVESGIRSGKISMASTSTSNPVKKPFYAKKEVNYMYGARDQTKKDDRQSVNVVRISNPTPSQSDLQIINNLRLHEDNSQG